MACYDYDTGTIAACSFSSLYQTGELPNTQVHFSVSSSPVIMPLTKDYVVKNGCDIYLNNRLVGFYISQEKFAKIAY